MNSRFAFYGAGGVMFLSVGVVISQRNYLLYHSAVEILGVAMSLAIFMTGWRALDRRTDYYPALMSVAYLTVGAIDLLHALAYRGMGVFPDGGANLPTQLWIAARLVETLSLTLAAVFYMKRYRASLSKLLYLYVGVGAALLTLIFVVKAFPLCYVDGVGLTAFKVWAEYLMVAAMGVTGLFLSRRARIRKDTVTLSLAGALVLTMLSELSFTLYTDVYGITNALGHGLKILSILVVFHFIMKAVYQKSDVISLYEDEVHRLTSYDALTGLFNRQFIEYVMKRLSARNMLPLSVIVASLNGLTLVNTTFGRKAGDELLKQFSAILKTSCRKHDLIGRWSGDEFIVLLPKTSGKEAETICQRIRIRCSEDEGTGIAISAALGVATCTKESTGNDPISEAEEAALLNKLRNQQGIRTSIMHSLERSLREKIPRTEEHTRRLEALAIQFGRILGLSQNRLEELALAARLHDIGKIAVSEEILNRPNDLSPEEWEAIREHSEIGYRICQSSVLLGPIAEAILFHHERWDGSGYPRGLKGEQIPLFGRILAIIDAYDVMTHDRSYAHAISPLQAIEMLKTGSGSRFDPRLVDLFVTYILQPETDASA